MNVLELDKPHEECGVAGIWGGDHTDAAKLLYYALIALQHRGQESAGIVTCDRKGPLGNICMHKGMGLVSEVFAADRLQELRGNIGIGHVRYSTTGASCEANAQPVFLNYLKGTLALAHNGNITNVDAIRDGLQEKGASFSGTTDSEVIAYRIALERLQTPSIEAAVMKTAAELKGGYALLVLSPQKLVGVRDPLGLKPLCLGQTEDGWILASESAAITAVGGTFVRDIEPGETITISAEGLHSDYRLRQEKRAHCVFEYIYFARLDSRIDGIPVYDARIRGGRALARRYPVEADVVTGVPESGLTAAVGYAEEAGIPYRPAFYKNSYVGRTFIKPSQEERASAVHMKLSLLDSVVKGKRVVLIDDSIVRGTTIANLIKMMRKAGALEIHVRISSPPFLYPCYYGTDVPDNSSLIANAMSTEEIRKSIGADSLEYMHLEDLDEMTEGLPLCKACFDNKYPV
ncbi:MAG: amidophosphoribosyltransferase [Eubacteriales bacterium]|nr:amidophosphoribosyltransferase [Eubacteriales bacterium]